MNTRTFLLIDGGQKGVASVLIGMPNVVIVNQLRRGVLDARLTWTVLPYDEANEQCTGFIPGKGFCTLPTEQRTEQYHERRALLRTRRKGFLRWDMLLMAHLLRDKSYPEDIDWYVEREISKSSPGHPSQGLLDYAHASGRSTDDVYEYFKMQIDQNANKRLMLHALAEKFATALNRCATETDVEDVSKKMEMEFWR